MDNFIGSAADLRDMTADRNFLSAPINTKAKDDFKFLCSRAGYMALNNVNYLDVRVLSDKKIGDFFIIGHNADDKVAYFPQPYIDVNLANLYVAVVYYENGTVSDVYCFKASGFKKTGIFSMFKKKDDWFSIVMPAKDKLKEYSFGYVIKKILEGEK